jgi:predicted site-specific integrase-resolvase
MVYIPMYVSSKEARAYFKVHEQTLRDWADAGKIECIRTPGGHRRYKLSKPPAPKSYVYARVSSAKQSADLDRQIKYLANRYPAHEIISDVGSGINFKRSGFRAILEQLFKRGIAEVVVASGDRFARFGATDFFVWLFDQFGAKLTILNTVAYKSKSDELAADLLEIITVFSARYHGSRKYADEEAPLLPNTTTG